MQLKDDIYFDDENNKKKKFLMNLSLSW